MDRIRTLLLARTHVVVMDPDRVAGAATRPSRDIDADKLEAELGELGYVMSLDLAMMMRRLPHQAMDEMRNWMFETLDSGPRPTVVAPRGLPQTVAWLATQPEQPCPWCGETRLLGALDPCGHLVCRSCWEGASFSGCPICHRRVAVDGPFVKIPEDAARVTSHGGRLTLLHLGTDMLGLARARFERLLSRISPLSPNDRAEIEMVIDAIGPAAASWLPPRIPLSETMAIAVARLWLISPHRDAAMRATRAHLRSASDVLRVAIVLMGGTPSLASPTRLRSLGRALRRAVLDVLEQLPLEDVIENMRRHRALWKRVGERLHPFERAHELPNTTLAFATLRGTDIATTSFAEKLHEQATHLPFVYLEDGRVRTIAWAAPIEEALRAGNPRSALARLTHRSGELLRRADHLVRIAQTRQLDALQTCVKAIELAAVKGPPAAMLMLASHVARRGRPWSRRVFFASGQPLRAWTAPDARRPLRGDAIAVIVGAIRRQLVTRAENKRQFPRAVLDRTLGELSLPLDESPRAQRSVVWPRSSELAIPEGQLVRVFVHGGTLAVELFDDNWRHHASCDAAHPVLGDDAATYVVSSSAQLVELHGEKLYARGAQHVVLTVRGTQPMFAGLLAEGQAFDPHAAAMRFDLPRRGTLAVALTIDLGERRLRWVDLPIRRADLDRVGGYRAALAHLGRAFADLAAAGARPTMWDLACIHASARANVIYVRERDGSYTMYRRRDNESRVGRLGRLLSGAADDGKLPTIPSVDAPTWFALVTGIGLPAGSIGYALDPGGLSPDAVRLAAGDLLAELALP